MNAKRIFLSAVVVVALFVGSPVLAKKSKTGAGLKVAGGGIVMAGAAWHLLLELTDHIKKYTNGKTWGLMPRRVLGRIVQDEAIILVSAYIMGKGLKDLKKIKKRKKKKHK